MNCHYHSHFYTGTTTVDQGHTHAYSGDTDYSNDTPCHTHGMAGCTSLVNGHIHAYCVVTGPSVMCGCRHTHCFRGVTTVDNAHSHCFEGYTSLA